MSELLQIIGASLRLDPDLWRDLLARPDALRFRPSLWIVVLAGLSEAIAQSTVLFMSRVRPGRMVASLLVNALLLAFGYAFFVVGIEVVATRIFARPGMDGLAFKMIALTYAPLILAAVTLVPYFGRAVSIWLHAYHVLALVVAVAVSYDLPPAQAALCVAVSWGVVHAVRATVGRPLGVLVDRLRDRVAGTPLMDRGELKRYYRSLVERDR